MASLYTVAPNIPGYFHYWVQWPALDYIPSTDDSEPQSTDLDWIFHPLLKQILIKFAFEVDQTAFKLIHRHEAYV